jgi:hypothetical protein
MHIIEHLSDRAVQQIKGYAERIREEELEREAEEEERRYQNMTDDDIIGEIAELKAKYGDTPNTETIAAMRDAEAGIGKKITIKELKAEISAFH